MTSGSPDHPERTTHVVPGLGQLIRTFGTLSVRRLGDEITDPSTGAVIGHELGKIVGVLQVADHLNEKLSVCVPQKGAGFTTGDLVMLDASKAAAPAGAE